MSDHLPPPSLKVQDLARRLIGTTAQGEIQDELTDLTLTEAKQLDQLALRCEDCDWWHTKTDIIDDGVKFRCRECFKEHADDDTNYEWMAMSAWLMQNSGDDKIGRTPMQDGWDIVGGALRRRRHD